MQHVDRLADARPQHPSLVAVGMFDGVHRGHGYLLRRLVETAHDRQMTPVVLTFFPHPDVVMGRASGRYYLTTPERRAILLGNLGIEWVITHPFNDEVRHIRAAQFVDELVRYLRLGELWVGTDFALGYKREGNVEFLRAQGAAKGFRLRALQLLTNSEGEQIISSSAIRTALQEGNLDQANQWLGRFYRISGEVVRGDGRGHTFGFATANLDVWDEQVLPQHGVYAGWAHLGDETFKAVANVGRRPTFEGKIVRLEVHILDFDRDIYGQTLMFDLVARLRPEMRFDGIDALVAQIKQDVAQAREVLDERTPPRP